MTSFDATRYGPAIAELLSGDRLSALGPGSPHLMARPLLFGFDLETAFAPHRILVRDMARACLAGLWLLHDFLDESHTISQEISTTSGSYWHALMHRREPDSSNAMYWFRRVGNHPVLRRLAEQAPSLGCKYENPQQFVDFCERVRDTGTPDEELAKKVQRLEWELLFDHCYRAAVGS